VTERALKLRLPNVTTRQLWHFIAAAETGKLAEAGRLLHMAPSAISSSISELETTLGVQLCVRHKAKGIVLTPSGEAALAVARNLMSDLIDFETSFSAETESAVARLTIGCYTSIAPLILPTSQSRFATVHPNAVVEFIEESHDGLQRLLLDGSIDMAFMYDLDIDHRLSRMPILQLTPSVLMSADHPFAAPGAPAAIPLAMLADEPIVLYSGSPLYEHYLRMFAEEGITPRIVHTSRTVGTVRAFVGRSTGVAVGYEKYALRMTVENREVVGKPLIGRSAPPLSIAVVLPRGAKPSTLARHWIDAAREALGDPPGT